MLRRLLAAGLALLAPVTVRAAETCVAHADQVVAWDAAADLYVVATYLERDRVPAPVEGRFPNLLELRRISTGAQLALVNCVAPGALAAAAATGPCDFRVVLADKLPAAARFASLGARIDRRRFAIWRQRRPDGGRDFALVAKPPSPGPDGRPPRWRRVLWLDHQPSGARERRALRLVRADLRPDEALLVIERHHSRGGCDRTSTEMLRVRARDIAAPLTREHQSHLLAQLKESSSFSLWRSAAAIAPLPPTRIVSGMVVAAQAGLPDFAAAWWRETTAQLPLDHVVKLAAAVRDRPELVAIEPVLALPAPPKPPA